MTEEELKQAEFDQQLGAAVREAALTDLILVMIAQHLCGSVYGGLLVAGESTTRVLNVCKTLVEARKDVPEPFRAEFLALLARCTPLFEERHRYVHGTAIPDSFGGLTTVRTRRLKAGVDTRPVDHDRLAALSADFHKLGLDLSDWLARLLGTLEPGMHPTDGSLTLKLEP
jgi:hypothetical protein